VAVDAVRIVQRFDRDWMTRGRRPAGICGAALLLAARMNNFRRSVEEIVQVVKIADTTLKKRLEEFKSSPSGALTLADFRNVWLEEEMDPPAFTRGREREETEKTASQHDGVGDGEERQKKAKAKKKTGDKLRKRRRREAEMEEPERDEPVVQEATMHPGQAFNTAILRDSILASAIDPELTSSPTLVDGNGNIDPVLLQESVPPLALSNSSTMHPVAPPVDLVEEQVSQVLAEEVTNFLRNPQGTKITGALDEAEERRLAQMAVVDELKNLNEEELDHFILSEDEVKIKERVWVELNRDYLEALAGELFGTFQ
jgi:transcription factor IIIB subunit 2